jgi:hypothetical protein
MSPPGIITRSWSGGDVREVYTVGSGAVIGVILMVDTDESREVPVMLPAARPGVAVGDRLRVCGRLAFEPMPNRRELLHFVRARWVDPVMHPRRA